MHDGRDWSFYWKGGLRYWRLGQNKRKREVGQRNDQKMRVPYYWRDVKLSHSSACKSKLDACTEGLHLKVRVSSILLSPIPLSLSSGALLSPWLPRLSKTQGLHELWSGFLFSAHYRLGRVPITPPRTHSVRSELLRLQRCVTWVPPVMILFTTKVPKTCH